MDQNPYAPGSAELKTEENKKSGGFLSFVKKLFIVLGVILGLIILLFIWAGISASNTHGKFDGKAKPFIEHFLENQSPWDYEQAKPQLSAAWFEVTTDDQGTKLFAFFNKLGALKSIDSIEWQGCSNQAHTSIGSIERCNYIVSASYENDVAQMLFGLSLEEDELKVMQLNVNSEAFLE